MSAESNALLDTLRDLISSGTALVKELEGNGAVASIHLVRRFDGSVRAAQQTIGIVEARGWKEAQAQGSTDEQK